LSLKDLSKVVQACIKHESKYQKILYEGYYGYALKIVFRYIYRYEKAVDVVNDGFVKLFIHFDRFSAEDDAFLEPKLMGWIRKIMVNCAIDALRKNEMIREAGLIPEAVWEDTDKSDNADQLVLYKEIIVQIKKLPPVYRAVFNMYVIDGLSHQEIANALGISVGTSKSNLWKARHLLQKYINGQEELEAC
jgi:RNA polymerase sigma factor (sigma-70 family)